MDAFEVREVPADCVEVWWPVLERAIARTLENSCNWQAIGDVYRLLLAGQYQLVVFSRGAWIGFSVLELNQTPEGPWLNHVLVYMKPAFRADLARCFEAIESAALADGVVGIRFLSARRGAARRAKQLGYTRRFVEFVKPIGRTE